MPEYRILQGDCLEILRGLPSGEFDACLTDPPYALGRTEKRNPRRMSPRKSSRDKATGFMGMEWDAEIPSPAVWRELLRVLRPGAPLLAFGGARTFHRLACAIEDGGFQLADTLCWLHGQGFPKSKAQLKPAWEPITLAWKEGARALNLDGCRLAADDAAYVRNCSGDRGHVDRPSGTAAVPFKMGGGCASDAGRWPANVVLDEEAARQLDATTGTLKSGANPARRRSPKTRNAYGEFPGQPDCIVHRGASEGGASRFFYCAKAKGSEREGNEHPTVKPAALTEWLARLLLAPGARSLLVPYSGSGSEIIGALRAGWPLVTGIEREPSYIAIAERRLQAEGFAGEPREIQETPEALPLFAGIPIPT